MYTWTAKWLLDMETKPVLFSTSARLETFFSEKITQYLPLSKGRTTEMPGVSSSLRFFTALCSDTSLL